ncbi:MFS transporter [Amycolatopsis jiangsuensis]|uniref:Sugar phosphate permease n=1 Tax=Amycolatopsis jiangsuensis TaxID=1181879 RepID=A0A840IPS2_9PSEU|nr:MFS transporter [Amycolatopsis jiangsuensis]MBB4683455.1 sugar phosphate permease [Amycolatopsis jiangsuensis]
MTESPEQPVSAPSSRRPVGKNMRWGIAVLIGVGILINYFDRSNLSVVEGPMSQDLGLSASQFGILLSSFGWSYLLFQIPMGALLDRIGVRWMQRVATLIWFVATALTALVSGMGLILFARLLLGAAEAPSLVAASKAVGYWFPVRERGLASASYEVAAKLSNVIALPLVAGATAIWGWQAGFLTTAILSLLYAAAFWLWYRDPQQKRSLSKQEYDYIVDGGAQQPGESAQPIVAGVGMFLRQRRIWGLSIGFAAYNYSFYLFLTWIPGYLEREMHMSVLKGGAYAVIPWIVATITDLVVAGWLVDRLIKKGYDPTKVRKTVLVVSMLFGLTVVGAAFTHSPGFAVLWITIAMGGLAAVSPVCWSIPSLIAPRGTVGTVGSIMNCIGQIGAITAPLITGFTVDASGAFATAFIIAGIILLIGIVSFVFVLGSLEQVTLGQPAAAVNS